jgi:N-acetylmuramoyl-L-alanine amidase
MRRCLPLCVIVLVALLGLPAAAMAALPYVAVDPGHGGADTGAVGYLPAGTPTGMTPRADDRGRTVLYEKDVNLDIGLRLDAWLRAQGGRTLLTRTRDLAGGDRPSTTTGADLKARTVAANAARVDLFVSIHNNALSTTASGSETFHYYYSSAAARALATLVQRELVATLRLPDRGVKTAGFYVLRNSEMPAILVEGGFLTNPAEALMLADPNVRQRIAEAVGRGIAAYSSQGVASPPRLAPTLGPWKSKPASAPAGYKLVKTGPGNPVGRGGWIAVIVGFAPPPSPLPATIGPWKVKPKTIPGGYRLVKSGPKNLVGKGGWLAVVNTASP